MAEPIRFQDIYGAHAPAVYRCLLAWSRNAATAEDLTAETFVRALSAEQDVRANTARAYLVAIARNLWLEQVRRGWRQQPMEAAPAPASHTNPDAALTLQSVLAAIAELPESLREPLVLFAQGELSYEEIAAQLELPIATVKVRIFRARQKLEKFR
jgi:RNA polymerase sigma-70 factor (ECF subfamily)